MLTSLVQKRSDHQHQREMVAMQIIVLNGSPKGDVSVTMQYVHFIQKNFPQHELKILNISHRTQAIEKEENVFQEIIDEIKSANAVLWAFPVYFLLVPPLITNDSSSSYGKEGPRIRSRTNTRRL